LKTLTKNINSSLRERLSKQKAKQSKRLVWVEATYMEAWTCSACAWAFLPTGPPMGDSLEEMIENYERLRDMEFSSHDCKQHPVRNAVLQHSSISYQKRIENTIRSVAQAMNAKA
jgi:hypothetical protein